MHMHVRLQINGNLQTLHTNVLHDIPSCMYYWMAFQLRWTDRNDQENNDSESLVTCIILRIAVVYSVLRVQSL